MGSTSRGRLIGIDALRGIAAFLVVLCHAWGSMEVFKQYFDPATFKLANLVFVIPALGYSGVYLFFVISGFCIHLRWAKAYATDSTEFPNLDMLAFWKRRWIRLYPAYIAALFAYIVMEHWFGGLKLGGLFVWDMVSHLLMIHNLDNRTAYSLNTVFWTLAIEEQLYLLYFLLLFVRKNWGWRVLLLISFLSRFGWLLISYSVTKFTSWELPFNEGVFANWWIWTLGALSVEVFYDVVELPRWCYSKALSAMFLILAGITRYAPIPWIEPKLWTNVKMVMEPLLWGAGFFLLINTVVRAEKERRPSFERHSMIRIWASIGIFSYSLYLTHELVVFPTMTTSKVLACALSLVFAYLFYLVFERPFVNYLAGKKRLAPVPALQ